ncbi:hypothetical protein [Pseudomonas sp. CFBP 13719]|uniref:hypothetical protein n=1 Tax=Pseudomonas sp. CFBP 13719 TaxID=2775303 RepID=UPI00177DE8EF|nr:hypothetical protein [Pseudomonas sp. CFBP 13719]MBD8682324.1 hypothetical protein [Pseudomonas sp. CFBP 13719]
MNPKLTEEEMRRALFGDVDEPEPINAPVNQGHVPEAVILPVSKPLVKKKAAKAFTPRLKVTLRVGNEYEGETFEMTHEADTLSTLLAEQEATKAARKKYRYVEVISVKSM